MNPALIIAKKRDGLELTSDEISDFVDAYARDNIPDYQMAALAMAIYFRGMSPRETAALTEEMLHSGSILEWSPGLPKVDKHSTGGVGDKVSLVLAPLMACCGVQVPMISGRGLGSTGGTLDKLESIPGFRTDLSRTEIQRITEDVGCVITGQTSDLVPADKWLYALRDVTATVPSVPLITASIMSKKLAESLNALVLDVKFGSGAFMKSIEEARTLAESLVATGMEAGLPVSALLTDMNQPLGRMVGNAVEVEEAVAALRGEGPADLTELTFALGSELLVMSSAVRNLREGLERLSVALRSGAGLKKFREMVAAQGGDLDAPRHVAPATELMSPRSGFIAVMNCEAVGQAIVMLGGGRWQATDRINHSIGIEMLVRIGDFVERGQPLMRVFSESDGFGRVREPLIDAMQFTDEQPEPRPLIVDRIGPKSVT